MPEHPSEQRHNAKLTANDARKILQLLAEGETGPSVAKRYGVSASTIWRIGKRYAWKDVER